MTPRKPKPLKLGEENWGQKVRRAYYLSKPGYWYVASADGALWTSSADPGAGVFGGKFLAPLNPEAYSNSGLELTEWDTTDTGATPNDMDALLALRCAR